jgi:hypothetical protein
VIIFKKYLDIRFYMANGNELHLQIFEDLRRQITDCVTLISSDELNNNALDYVHRKLDQIWREVFRLTEVNIVDEYILHCVSDAIACLQRVEEVEYSTSYQAPLVNDGSTGRPVFNITHDQLYFFLAHGFTGPAIANMLGVSLRTVRRRINQYGLFKNVFRSDVTDAELDDIVSNVMEQFPNIGYRLLEGELRRRNIVITRARCREVLRRLDPVGVVDRLHSLCYRRKYSVYGPLALWHVDGNHKLIR